jgi:hypothetical protein
MPREPPSALHQIISAIAKVEQEKPRFPQVDRVKNESEQRKLQIDTN